MWKGTVKKGTSGLGGGEMCGYGLLSSETKEALT